MLLQIAEPGESKVKEACKARVVGIDLGTTNSLVAHIADADPVVIGDILPSVVYYAPDGSTLVGRDAEAHAIESPRETLASVKRLIGRGAKDLAAIRGMLPYELVGDDRSVKIAVRGREVTPIEVSAKVLGELKQRAEKALGGPIEGAVITVPAYFDDAQRQATRDAGRLAGLEVLRLLAEPTAAALAYGLDRGSQGTYAVFDLGGGTFDISILRLVDGVFEVKATGGDSALGGDDLDRAVAQELFAADMSSNDRQRIAAAVARARRIKERLTEATEVDGFSRQDLRRCAQPLLDRCSKACRRAVKDAELADSADRSESGRLQLGAELDGVILVGGSTRSPVVRDFVRELFGKEPLCDLDPDQVVALGAAVQ